ncbi:MAG: glutaredoxin family protein [Nitrospinota bacterium]|nr:glutaredoxin family protein [Nitrospinota bacterium]
MSEIKLYSTTWCPDCHAAKRVLDEKKIPYKLIDIDENQDAIPIIVAARGKKVVPTLEYKGAFMDGNHFDLARFEAELKELLNR